MLFEQIGEQTQAEMKLFTDHLVAKAEQYESDMSGESWPHESVLSLLASNSNYAPLTNLAEWQKEILSSIGPRSLAENLSARQ